MAPSFLQFSSYGPSNDLQCYHSNEERAVVSIKSWKNCTVISWQSASCKYRVSSMNRIKYKWKGSSQLWSKLAVTNKAQKRNEHPMPGIWTRDEHRVRILLEPQDFFFLGFIVNCLSHFITARITFIRCVLIWSLSYTHHVNKIKGEIDIKLEVTVRGIFLLLLPNRS